MPEQDIISKKTAYKIEINEVLDSTADISTLLKNSKNKLTKLKGNGDFASEECLKILEKSDIVVTNPPFSCMRAFVSTLFNYDKKFLIIGSKNAITYKEIFPLIKENKMWFGYTNVPKFIQPDGSEKQFGNVGWYTNLDVKIRHDYLILYEHYRPEKYPKYDNYDAIDVSKVCEIPMDYDGIMGVPISFIDKYNPEQFEILSANDYRKNDSVPVKAHGLIKDKDGAINGKPKYARILIKRKEHFYEN